MATRVVVKTQRFACPLLGSVANVSLRYLEQAAADGTGKPTPLGPIGMDCAEHRGCGICGDDESASPPDFPGRCVHPFHARARERR